METTALVAELLVIGFQSLVWIGLLLTALFGLDPLVLLGLAFEKAHVFTTATLIGLAYLVGIIIEQLSLRAFGSEGIRHCKRSEAIPYDAGGDCFVAKTAPRNDRRVPPKKSKRSHSQRVFVARCPVVYNGYSAP